MYSTIRQTDDVRLLVFANNFPSEDSPYNGIFVLRQLLALERLGYKARVVRVVPRAPGWSKKWRGYRSIPVRYQVEGIEVRTLRAFFLPRDYGIEYLRPQLNRQLGRIVRDYNPHLIQAHGLLPAGALAVDWGLPTIVTGHGTDAYDLPWRRYGLENLARGVVQSSTAVVAVSAFVGSKLERLGAKKVAIVFNGADERIFLPKNRLDSRQRLGLPEDRKIVIFAGDLVRRKGTFDLLRAAATLDDLRPLIIMLGAGDDREALRETAVHLGVELLTPGLCNHVELAVYLGAADVVALPSYREGLPAVICEAMLAERTVVATPVGGIPEVIVDKVTGRIAPVGDVPSLAMVLGDVLLNPQDNARMASTARQFAQARLTWSENAKQYDLIYKEQLSRHLN